MMGDVVPLLWSSEYVVVIVAVTVFVLISRSTRRIAGLSRSVGTDAEAPTGWVRAGRWASICVLVGWALFFTSFFAPAIEWVPTTPVNVLPAWSRYATAAAGAALGGAILLAVALLRARRTVPPRALDPIRRGWSAFAPRPLLIGSIAVLILLAVVVVIGGLAADLDDRGRSILATTDFGGFAASTLFPGWYFGLPALISGLVASALALGTLAATSRSALAAGPARDADIAGRRAAASIALRVLFGGVAITLGRLVVFLATAGMGRSQIPTEGGDVVIESTYAAITGPLGFVGALAMGIGVAIVATVLFTRSPGSRGVTTRSSGGATSA